MSETLGKQVLVGLHSGSVRGPTPPSWGFGDVTGPAPPAPIKPGHRHDQALNLTGEVHRVLDSWCRGSDGRWYGVVSFAVPYLGLVPSVGLEF